MYELTVENGVVSFLLRTGKDFVKGTMEESQARQIISEGESLEKCIEGYPININDTYFFKGHKVETKVKRGKRNE